MTQQTSKVGVLSAWIYPGVSSQEQFVVDSRGTVPVTNRYVSCGVFSFDGGTTHGFEVTVLNSSGGTGMSMFSANGDITPNAWNHVLAAWDVGNARADMFIDDVQSVLQVQTTVDTQLGYNRSDRWVIGENALTAGLNNFLGRMEEIYLNTTDYLDITTEANRRKFYGAQGSKIGLGHKARVPTGSEPILFFNKGPGNFGSNEGTGGGLLTPTGSPTFDRGRPAQVETISRGFRGEEWRESERSGIPFNESRLVIEPASGLEVSRREFSTDRDEINRRRRFGSSIFEF